MLPSNLRPSRGGREGTCSHEKNHLVPQIFCFLFPKITFVPLFPLLQHPYSLEINVLVPVPQNQNPKEGLKLDVKFHPVMDGHSACSQLHFVSENLGSLRFVLSVEKDDCDLSCPGRCYKPGILGCCHPECAIGCHGSLDTECEVNSPIITIQAWLTKWHKNVGSLIESLWAPKSRI